MSVNTTQHAGNYNDFEGLANLRSQAQRDQKSAINETAQQFEALFIQMMLAEMRKSIPKEGLFDSQASSCIFAIFFKGIFGFVFSFRALSLFIFTHDK